MKAGRYGVSSTLAANLFIQVCTVLQGVLLARTLGPAGRGEFATVILWPSFFAGLGIAGADIALARLAGQGLATRSLVQSALNSAVITGLPTALLCAISLPFLVPSEKHDLLQACYLFALFIPLNHLGANLQSIDQGSGNFVWMNLTRAAIYPFFFIGIGVAAAFASNKVIWIVGALLAANFLVVLLRLFARRRELTGTEREPTRLSAIFRAGIPFISASLISTVYTQSDKVLLVWLLPSEQVGLYAAAFAAAGTVNALTNAFGMIQFSASVKAEYQTGFLDLAAAMRRGAIFSLLAIVSLYAVLPFLMPIIYGKEFSGAVFPTRLLLPGMFMAGLTDIVDQALRGQGRPMPGVISKLVGLIALGIVGAYLSPKIGIDGIAIAYVVSQIILFLSISIVTFRHYVDADLRALMPGRHDIEFVVRKLIKKNSENGLNI